MKATYALGAQSYQVGEKARQQFTEAVSHFMPRTGGVLLGGDPGKKLLKSVKDRIPAFLAYVASQAERGGSYTISEDALHTWAKTVGKIAGKAKKKEGEEIRSAFVEFAHRVLPGRQAWIEDCCRAGGIPYRPPGQGGDGIDV